MHEGAGSIGGRPKADVYGLTHTGLVRRENQDQFLIGTIHKTMRMLQTSLPDDALGTLLSPSRGWVALVADGVGGIPGGQEASQTALRSVVDYVVQMMDLYLRLDQEVEPEFVAELQRSVEAGHQELRRASGEHQSPLTGATTLTMVCVRWPRAFLVHAGDSRCYRLRGELLELLTRDQTMAQAMVDAGSLSPDQAELSGLRNILYSALGAARLDPFTLATDITLGDRMLLCTDGLTKHVSDEEIRQALLRSTGAERTARELLQLALDRGGTDNTTLIVGRLAVPEQGSAA